MKIFDTVVEGPVEEVLEDWIDYNGHMNVAIILLRSIVQLTFF